MPHFTLCPVLPRAALSAAAAAGLGTLVCPSSSGAALVQFDLRLPGNAQQAAAGGFGAIVSADGKMLTPTSASGDIVAELWAMVANNDGNINNDCFLFGQFSVVGTGSFLTDLRFGSYATGFNFSTPSTGKSQDLDADTDLDIGSNALLHGNANDFFIPVSANPEYNAVIGAKGGLVPSNLLVAGKFGPETVNGQDYVSFEVGTFDITWNHPLAGSTAIQVRPRVFLDSTSDVRKLIAVVSDGLGPSANLPGVNPGVTLIAGDSSDFSLGRPIVIGESPMVPIALVNRATDDPARPNISVTGHDGSYTSNVATFAAAASGGVDIVGFPSPATDKPIEVLLDLGGFSSPAELDQVLTYFVPAIGDVSLASFTYSTDHSGDIAEFNKVSSLLAGTGRSWDVLITFSSFPSPANSSSLGFTFDFSQTVARVNNIAVVPEPGALSLLGLGALGLLGRRRRHA